MSWNCQQCDSEVDDDFDICWSCGASFDGEENPHFAPEIEATELPADGTRVIHCAECNYRGPSKRVIATRGVVGFILSFVGLGEPLTNHTCPVCGESRQIYDWKQGGRSESQHSSVADGRDND